MRRTLTAAVTVALVVPAGLHATVAPTARPGGVVGGLPDDVGLLAGEIPQPMLGAYLDAAVTWQVDWALLAAIGKVECDHGRARAPGCWPPGTVNHAGARGPMQFLGSTWRADADRHQPEVAGPPAPDGQGWATDGDGDGDADPWSAYDAVHAAARYLIDLDVADDAHRAARGYNAGPANPDPTAGAGYADRIVALAAHYHTLAGSSPASAVVVAGRYALPFDPAGLTAVTVHASPPRDPEWQLVRPHHSGRVAVDIALPVGTPLYALTAATVVWAGRLGRCGDAVILRAPTDGPADIVYCHLSTITATAGQQVPAGGLLGRSGGAPGHPGAGNSTGAHLHLHIDTPAGRRCPQALLLALWRGWPPPPIDALRTAGCTYTTSPPTPHRPVPLPPDLPPPASPTGEQATT